MKKASFLILWVALTFISGSCNLIDDGDVAPNPFDNMSMSSNKDRDKIVVISDLHLGSDLEYSETVKHLSRLVEFLKEVRSSRTVRELVIGGDVLDEWYVPTRIDTYGGGSQADFIRKSVAANQGVFDVLNGIIKDGKIKLTYLPGNHDMGFLPENINIAIPGVNQARDAGAKYPVGTYNPDGYPEIAIEHGHRYDFFNAMLVNNAMLPPGYFFARIAANSFTDPTTFEAATKVPAVTLKNPADPEQRTKFLYYNLWREVMTNLIYVKDDFSEPIFKTNLGGFTKTYSINDVLPKNCIDGSIQVDLYNDLFTQANWEARLKYNNVPVMTNIDSALVGSLKTEFLDSQADVQYFQNPNSYVRIVVFGHTHKPKIKTYTNTRGETCIYANSGTWEDKKSRDKNAPIDQDKLHMDFVTIIPVNSNKKKIQVSLFQYYEGKHLLKDSKEVDL